MKGMTRAALAAAVTAIVGASACGGTYGEPAAQPASFKQTSTGVMAVAPLAPAPTATEPVSNMAPPTSPGSVAPSALGTASSLAREDAQMPLLAPTPAPIAPEDVLGTLQAASDAQRDLAELAATRARTPEVRALAAAVSASERDTRARTSRMAEQLDVTPRDDERAAILATSAAAAVARTKAAEGPLFDALYLHGQADLERQILEAVDVMGRGTASEALRDHLAIVSKETGDRLARTSALEERLAVEVQRAGPRRAPRSAGDEPASKAKRAP